MNYQFTVTELKKKKDSLMASFRTCLAKVKSSHRSGAGADELYKPIWFAYQKMASYLINKDDPKETINTEVSNFHKCNNNNESICNGV